MAIPALSIEEDGSLGGMDAVLNSIVKKWTTDPATSNNFTNSFYEMAGEDGILDTIMEEAQTDRPQGLLLSSLTQEQVDQAYEEAKAMMSTGGIAYETKKAITDAYKKIDQINNNTSLSDDEKYTQTRSIRLEMLKQVEAANEEMQVFYKKYIQGETLTDRVFDNFRKIFTEDKYVHIKTAPEEMSQIYQNDIDKEEYMNRAMSVFNGPSGTKLGGGKKEALPHPSYKFTKTVDEDEIEYSIPEGKEREKYDEVYRNTYREYVMGLLPNYKWSKLVMEKGWDNLTDQQRYEVLKAAASQANKKMQELYLQLNK